MSEPIRILICDDHPVVRAGLQGMLSEQLDFTVVGEAENGREVIELAKRLRPDVVLMDLRIPEIDGVAATEEITVQCPETNVLVLTTYDSDADILRAIEAGATGYLLKDAPMRDLHDGIRTAARGQAMLAPSVAQRLIHNVRRPSRQTLSTREIEVLELVRGGLSNKEIARELQVSEATIKTHLIHIYGKLDVTDRTAAVNAALEHGILKLGS